MKSGDPLNKPRDFLDTVLMARDEDGTGLTVQEISDEVNTFLFGGHDTTASTLTWVLYELARHPEHQAKVREEVDEILDGRDSDRITRCGNNLKIVQQIEETIVGILSNVMLSMNCKYLSRLHVVVCLCLSRLSYIKNTSLCEC